MKFKIIFILLFVFLIFSNNSYAERFYQFQRDEYKFYVDIDRIVGFGNFDGNILIYLSNYTVPIKIDNIDYDCFIKLLGKEILKHSCNCKCCE